VKRAASGDVGTLVGRSARLPPRASPDRELGLAPAMLAGMGDCSGKLGWVLSDEPGSPPSVGSAKSISFSFLLVPCPGWIRLGSQYSNLRVLAAKSDQFTMLPTSKIKELIVPAGMLYLT
jgi:hypothetical protein